MADFVGNTTVPTLIRRAARQWGDRTFLEFEGGSITYAELLGRVSSVALELHDAGVRQGDFVVVHLTNSPQWIISTWAVQSLGAAAVTTNSLYGPDELGYIVENCAATCVVTEAGLLETVTSALRHSAGAVQVLVTGRDIGSPSAAPPARVVGQWVDDDAPGKLDSLGVEIAPATPASVIYTSGTTAKPKGVVYLHGNHVFAGHYTGQLVRQSGDDRHLLMLPLSHMAAQSISLYPVLSVGATLLLHDGFVAREFSGIVAAERPTIASLTSTMIRAIVALPKATTDAESSLRIGYLGLRLGDEEWDEFERRFGCILLEEIGQTEIGTIQLLNPLDGERKRRCSGLPGLGYDVRIVDEKGRELGPGEAGEMIVRGVSRFALTAGYLNDPEANAQLIRNGWLYTGDIMRLDDDGYFHFVDRKKNMIKRSGYNISASEVEEALLSHPLVVDAAVVGVPDRFRDEAVGAYVVLRGDLSEEDLTQHCRSKLAPFKVPTYWERLDSLPRNFIGKVEHKVLRERARSALQARP